MVFAETDAVK
jgi:hypothetical protein